MATMLLEFSHGKCQISATVTRSSLEKQVHPKRTQRLAQKQLKERMESTKKEVVEIK